MDTEFHSRIEGLEELCRQMLEETRAFREEQRAAGKELLEIVNSLCSEMDETHQDVSHLKELAGILRSDRD